MIKKYSICIGLLVACFGSASAAFIVNPWAGLELPDLGDARVGVADIDDHPVVAAAVTGNTEVLERNALGGRVFGQNVFFLSILLSSCLTPISAVSRMIQLMFYVHLNAPSSHEYLVSFLQSPNANLPNRIS